MTGFTRAAACLAMSRAASVFSAVASATPGRHCHKERPIGSDIAQTVCENDADYANGQATVQDIKDHMHPVTSNIK